MPITPQSKFLDISTAEDSHLINDLIYYMNYSLAIFGWPMQMVDDPCMLCCICPYLKLSRCCGGSGRTIKPVIEKEKSKKKKKKKREEDGEKDEEKEAINVDTEKEKSDRLDRISKQDAKSSADCCIEANDKPSKAKYETGKLNEDCGRPIILEDNCCGCNVASVERRLAAHNYEIIYVSYKVNINVVPFLVAADHSKQSVVVAMRGSMSLSDMVTDMNGQTDKLPIEDCPDDWLCHRGITRAASYVKSTLLQEFILDRAFNCRPDLGSQEYSLILCGHSLGAGVAAILGILLRKHYPNLKAYLYSPPGGMLSLPVVEYTKQFATGIILGNDCVPRLGIAQLERLRYHVLLSLKSSQRSTSKVLARALCPSCCFGTNNVEYDPSQSLNLLHGTGGRSFDFKGSKIPFQVQPQVLYVPGRLIHIVKNYSFKSKARRLFNEPIYQAIWHENTAYDRIMISEGMFYDHLPNNLMHAMKMLFSKTLPARKESKSTASEMSSGLQMTTDSHPTSLQCGLNKDLSEIQNDSKQIDQEVVIENNNNSNSDNNSGLGCDVNNNEDINPIKSVYLDSNLDDSSSTLHSKIEKNLDVNGNDRRLCSNNSS